MIKVTYMCLELTESYSVFIIIKNNNSNET